VPVFVKKQWSETNQVGEIWPQAAVALSTNGQPEYVVIYWLGYGIAVGHPDYQLSFNADGIIQVKPGLYTYYFYK